MRTNQTRSPGRGRSLSGRAEAARSGAGDGVSEGRAGGLETPGCGRASASGAFSFKSGGANRGAGPGPGPAGVRKCP